MTRERKRKRRRKAVTLRPLDDYLKGKAVRMYGIEPNVRTVARALNVDPLELSTYLNTDSTARNMREIHRAINIGKGLDKAERILDKSLIAYEHHANNVIKQQAQTGAADPEDMKTLTTITKQLFDHKRWGAEQQNTQVREEAILEHYERHAAEQHIAPAAAPLGLDMEGPRDVTPLQDPEP